MRTIASWTVLIIVSLSVVSTACNQSSAAGNDGSAVEEEDNGDDADGNTSNSTDCSTDTDCESYYRCIDDVCSKPPAMTGEVEDDTPIAEFVGDDGQQLASFYLELAVTEEEQSRGLMYRPEMEPDWGMLFIYDQERQLSFWMKNTLIELDMIFVGADGEVVGIVEEAEPETQRPRGVGEPAQFVLEVNGGLAAEHGIEPGTTMRLEHVQEHHEAGQ